MSGELVKLAGGSVTLDFELMCRGMSHDDIHDLVRDAVEGAFVGRVGVVVRSAGVRPFGYWSQGVES